MGRGYTLSLIEWPACIVTHSIWIRNKRSSQFSFTICFCKYINACSDTMYYIRKTCSSMFGNRILHLIIIVKQPLSIISCSVHNMQDTTASDKACIVSSLSKFVLNKHACTVLPCMHRRALTGKYQYKHMLTNKHKLQ